MEKNNNLDSLGRRIKFVRKETKQKQLLFAESLGISQSHLSGIEKDSVNPSPTLIKLICVKYNVSEKWLLNGTGEYRLLGDLCSKEGCNSRYKLITTTAEEMLEICNKDNIEENLISYVSAYSYAVTTLTYAFQFKDLEIKTRYLALLMSIYDDLEKYMHSLKCAGVTPSSLSYITQISSNIAKISEFHTKY